ncbi:MAG: N-acetyltransferase [Oscillospiraceae bacterium]|nr:N-acetyltransferase [Oscillospiraceae bacterium]
MKKGLNENMNISFRLETPADYYNVEAMTRETFWNNFWEKEQLMCDEHFLLHKLRTCPSFVPELNCVAEYDGELAGHIIYTRARVENQEVLTFGPLTVSPGHQSKGIGRALMRHTFDVAVRMGFRAVLIYGHPDYYPRAGFRRAAEFGITTPGGIVFDALMIYPLYENAMNGISGRLFIDPVYESLTQEEVLEFDKRFPPKELHVPLPVDVLLERLEPGARKGIESQNFCSLTYLKTKSEREISLLPGIDEKAIEIIRTVMKENKLAWGKERM